MNTFEALIVGDDRGVRAALRTCLPIEDFAVREAASGAAALAEIVTRLPVVVDPFPDQIARRA